jgi:hypothetical protein
MRFHRAVPSGVATLLVAGLLFSSFAFWPAPASSQYFGYSRYRSPRASATVTLDGKVIRIDYYAPSMHGRKIMGDLVPFGEVWCTGANWATQITTPVDLRIGDIKVPKGSYSIWTVPDEKEWTLILNKETGQFHTDYNPEADFARTKMKVGKLGKPVETFTIDLRAEGGNRGTLSLQWETTEASVPFSVQP